MPWLRRRPCGRNSAAAAGEVGVELRQADVLEHADRADGVVRTVVHVAEVGEAHLDAVAQAALGGPLAGQLGLRTRERDADGVHAVVLGRVQQHAAPPTADVEEAHAGLEVELAADELVLVRLGVLQRGGVVVPHRAGVCERRPEHHPVEVVGDVVVVRDRGGVALARVTPALQPRLLGRRRERLQPLPPDELGGSHDLSGAEPQLLDVLGDGHHVEDVAVDLELTGDVGASEPQLVGGGDDAAERVRGAHHDGRAGIGRPEARPVVGPERDRHLVAEHVGQEIRNAHDHPLSSGASHGGHSRHRRAGYPPRRSSAHVGPRGLQTRASPARSDQARTSIATRMKWQAAAATVIACHTSWYPNTSGRGLGRCRRSPIAPRV